MKWPPYYRDKFGVEYASSQRFVESAEFALKSLAKFLGREEEYESFLEHRMLMWDRMNKPKGPEVEYEDYLKKIPYWVTIMEEPLNKMYQAGLDDSSDTRLPVDGNRWNNQSARRRKETESVIRSVAKVFGKEDEFEEFLKARDKLTMSKLNEDGSKTANYEKVMKEYLDATPNWLESVTLALIKYYKMGVEESLYTRKKSKKRKKKKT